jgi:hypothetical protein
MLIIYLNAGLGKKTKVVLFTKCDLMYDFL